MRRWLLATVVALTTVWSVTALWLQHPPHVAAWIGVAIATMLACLWLSVRKESGMTERRAGWGIYVLACAALAFWWTGISPSNSRDWAPDVLRQTQGHVDGDIATIENVRNFTWRSNTDFTPRWETRHYDLRQLRSVDVVLSYWGSPAIAHTLVSFGFAGGEQVVFSVEIRRERQESFSEIGGFFKVFELSVIAADERDIIAVRTNVRGEDDYLYRVAMEPALMRSLFESYVAQANALVDTPRFYQTVTANCTTIVYDMARRLVKGLPLDYRILLSGYLPEYLYDIDALRGASSPQAYRTGGRITERAHAAGDSQAFSGAIRQGVPGIDSP